MRTIEVLSHGLIDPNTISVLSHGLFLEQQAAVIRGGGNGQHGRRSSAYWSAPHYPHEIKRPEVQVPKVKRLIKAVAYEDDEKAAELVAAQEELELQARTLEAQEKAQVKAEAEVTAKIEREAVIQSLLDEHRRLKTQQFANAKIRFEQARAEAMQARAEAEAQRLGAELQAQVESARIKQIRDEEEIALVLALAA